MATGFAFSLISSSPHTATFLSSSSSSSSSSLHSYLPLRTTTLPSLSSTSPITTPFKKSILFHNPLRPIILPPPAAAEDVISTAETAADAVEKLYPTTDKGVATVVSALFFLAFLGLSAITIGVSKISVEQKKTLICLK